MYKKKTFETFSGSIRKTLTFRVRYAESFEWCLRVSLVIVSIQTLYVSIARRKSHTILLPSDKTFQVNENNLVTTKLNKLCILYLYVHIVAKERRKKFICRKYRKEIARFKDQGERLVLY